MLHPTLETRHIYTVLSKHYAAMEAIVPSRPFGPRPILKRLQDTTAKDWQIICN